MFLFSFIKKKKNKNSGKLIPVIYQYIVKVHSNLITDDRVKNKKHI